MKSTFGKGILFVALVLTALGACRKVQDNEQPGPYHSNPYYDFSYYVYWFNPNLPEVTVFPDDTVRFQVNTNVDSVQINFGDGGFSTSKSCWHVYHKSGDYRVSLTKGADTLKWNTFTVKNAPDSNLRAHLARVRPWRIFYFPDFSGPVTYDTFAVTLLGTGRIIFKGDTVSAGDIYDANSAKPFIYYAGLQGPPYHGCDFYYYWLQDSIYVVPWSENTIDKKYYLSP